MSFFLMTSFSWQMKYRPSIWNGARKWRWPARALCPRQLQPKRITYQRQANPPMSKREGTAIQVTRNARPSLNARHARDGSMVRVSHPCSTNALFSIFHTFCQRRPSTTQKMARQSFHVQKLKRRQRLPKFPPDCPENRRRRQRPTTTRIILGEMHHLQH